MSAPVEVADETNGGADQLQLPPVLAIGVDDLDAGPAGLVANKLLAVFYRPIGNRQRQTFAVGRPAQARDTNVWVLQNGAAVPAIDVHDPQVHFSRHRSDVRDASAIGREAHVERAPRFGEGGWVLAVWGHEIEPVLPGIT